jgi:hypothetical protein
MPPAVPFTRPLYPPSHAKGPVDDGVDVVAIKRAISRAGWWPWQAFDDTYSEAFAMDGVAGFQESVKISATGNYGSATHAELVAAHRKGSVTEWAFDEVSIRLMQQAASGPPPGLVPPLGPVCEGGLPVTSQDCTHRTSGLDLYPAFDDCFGAGRMVLAPEPLVVTRTSTSRPGQSVYADGGSGIRWYVCHLSAVPAVGARFAKGQPIGLTIPTTEGGGPHAHIGCNVEKIWGAGRQLLHHTNYTHGAPKIGVQLAAAGRIL